MKNKIFTLLFSVILGVFSVFLTGCDPSADPEKATWKEVFDEPSDQWFLSVWGRSGDDLYIAGGTPNTGALRRFDGETWEEVELGTPTPLLNWVIGFEDGSLFVVGNEGVILEKSDETWHLMDSQTTQNLWGIWGTSPNNLWAVGGSGRVAGDATLLHFDGNIWSPVELPEMERPNVFAFFKVWGTSADNLYVVGQQGALLHFDGQSWRELLIGTSEDLIALWGSGPDHIIVVGGRSNGVVSVWDGNIWNTQSLAPLPGLNGVWMQDDNIAHVVGVEGTIARLDLTTFEVEITELETRLDLHAVFGVDGQLTTVGGSFASSAPPFSSLAFSREMNSGD